jgi:multiple sugar transport system permease protein
VSLIARTPASGAATQHPGRRLGLALPRFHFKWWGLIFALPAVAFFATFNLFPMLFGLYLSFTDYDLLNPPTWVGIDNFVNLVTDRLFLAALRNTLLFVAGATVPVWGLSLLAALLFDQAFRGREILKATFFLPVLPPIVVVAVVWRVLLHPNGVMTWLVGGAWGTTEIRWLADAVLAPLSIIAVHDWAAIPFFMMIWLAGLAGVPQELREAAALDGAGPIRTFWNVELPQLRATAVLVAALSSIGAFQTFALQYVIPTDPGGPSNSTLVLGLLVLKYGFQYFRMGDAAAVSVVMFAMILLVTVVQLRLNRRA